MNELIDANKPMTIITPRYLSFFSWVIAPNKKV